MLEFMFEVLVLLLAIGLFYLFYRFIIAVLRSALGYKLDKKCEELGAFARSIFVSDGWDCTEYGAIYDEDGGYIKASFLRNHVEFNITISPVGKTNYKVCVTYSEVTDSDQYVYRNTDTKPEIEKIIKSFPSILKKKYQV